MKGNPQGGRRQQKEREGPLRPLRGHLPIGEADSRLGKVKLGGALGAFLLQRPPNPQMRLKDKAFRHLRMAAKGAALGSRRLLKKAGENFAYATVQRAKTLLMQPCSERKLCLCSRAAGENFAMAAPRAGESPSYLLGLPIPDAVEAPEPRLGQ